MRAPKMQAAPKMPDPPPPTAMPDPDGANVQQRVRAARAAVMSRYGSSATALGGATGRSTPQMPQSQRPSLGAG